LWLVEPTDTARSERLRRDQCRPSARGWPTGTRWGLDPMQRSASVRPVAELRCSAA